MCTSLLFGSRLEDNPANAGLCFDLEKRRRKAHMLHTGPDTARASGAKLLPARHVGHSQHHLPGRREGHLCRVRLGRGPCCLAPVSLGSTRPPMNLDVLQTAQGMLQKHSVVMRRVSHTRCARARVRPSTRRRRRMHQERADADDHLNWTPSTYSPVCKDHPGPAGNSDRHDAHPRTYRQLRLAPP